MAWVRYRARLSRILDGGIRAAAIPELQRAKDTAGDFVDLRVGPFRLLLVSDPVAIEEVLVRKHRTFIRGEPNWSHLRRGLGNGLVTSDGEFHQRQRRLIQPVFTPKCSETYGRIILDETQRLCRDWQGFVDHTLDLNAEMMRLTMLVIAKVMFGLNLRSDAERIARAVTDLNEAATTFDLSLGGYWGFVPTRANRKLRRAVRYLDDLVMRVRDQHRQSQRSTPHDVLSMLMATPMTDREVRDEVVTLFAAGHETTANLLTWTWYLLAQNADVERRLHDELATILGGRAPKAEDLPRLEYTEWVLKEAMRLYPPVWVNSRVAAETETVSGHPVEAGAIVVMCPYLVHRDPRWFAAPEVFDPERFHSESIDRRHRFAYFPFGGGARRCVGESFAEIEGRLVLATLAQHFTPRLLPDHAVELEPMVSLRPKGGLPMRLLERGDSGPAADPLA